MARPRRSFSTEFKREAGKSVTDVSRKLDLAEQTFYRWKKEYGGLEPGQVREVKQICDENARLKKLVVDISLDKAMLQDINSRTW